MAGKSGIYITLEVDDKGSAKLKKFGGNADKAFSKIKSGVKTATDQSGRMESRWTGSINRLKGKWQDYSAVMKGVVVAGAALAGVAIKKAIDLASELAEVQGKFDVVFTGQRTKAEGWARTLVNSYAMSTREAKEYLSSIQDLLVPMGMQSTAAGIFSFEITKLAADLGSFNNVPTADVMRDIQAALVGSAVTMSKYGVILKVARVQEKALAMGLAETRGEITLSQKAQAIYALMLQDSKAALGDQIRTAGSYVNVLKKEKAMVADAAAAFGTRLIPAATLMIKAFGLLTKGATAFIGALSGTFISIVDNVNRGWIDINHVTSLGVEYIEHAWYSVLESIEDLWVGFVDKVADGLEMLPFGEKLTGPMREYIEEMGIAGAENERHETTVAALNKEYDNAIASHESIINEMIKENEGHTQNAAISLKSARVQKTAVIDLAKAQKAAAQEVADQAARLMQQQKKDLASWQKIKNTYWKTATQIQLDELDLQYAKYSEVAEDKISLEQWYADEKARIQAVSAEAETVLLEKAKDKHEEFAMSTTDVFEKMFSGLSGDFGDLFGGISSGFDSLIRSSTSKAGSMLGSIGGFSGAAVVGAGVTLQHWAASALAKKAGVKQPIWDKYPGSEYTPLGQAAFAGQLGGQFYSGSANTFGLPTGEKAEQGAEVAAALCFLMTGNPLAAALAALAGGAVVGSIFGDGKRAYMGGKVDVSTGGANLFDTDFTSHARRLNKKNKAGNDAAMTGIVDTMLGGYQQIYEIMGTAQQEMVDASVHDVSFEIYTRGGNASKYFKAEIEELPGRIDRAMSPMFAGAVSAYLDDVTGAYSGISGTLPGDMLADIKDMQSAAGGNLEDLAALVTAVQTFQAVVNETLAGPIANMKQGILDALNIEDQASRWASFAEHIKKTMYDSVLDGMVQAMLETEAYKAALLPVTLAIQDAMSTASTAGTVMAFDSVIPALENYFDVVEQFRPVFEQISGFADNLRSGDLGLSTSGVSGGVQIGNLVNIEGNNHILDDDFIEDISIAVRGGIQDLEDLRH